MNNHGLDWEKELKDQSEEDWLAGSSTLTCLASIPPAQVKEYLPSGEVQIGREDTKDCASRSVNNILETKFNYLIAHDLISSETLAWFVKVGFINDTECFESSDAWIAINSNTTRQGNSLKAPIEAARKHGLIPKKLMPLESWMTWDDYHNPKRITPQLIAIGAEFARRIKINYERVAEDDFGRFLKKDLIDVGGFAWPRPDDKGVYPKTGGQANHAFVVFGEKRYTAFDNYPDSFDGDFIKALASNYDLVQYGYRILITSEIPNPPQDMWVVDILKNIVEALKDILKKLR